ncbi:UDP-N-acetylglucosamine 1-carboxyvinyltransferase [Candidatus Uhrbacteria bacterium]|nr:UDP-N-acetylglucosamine 1-carboxyvinyltransferase [Candidatus Uhrbacteria bacterium]
MRVQHHSLQLVIDGPTTLQGSISVAGAKNAVLKLFAAALLCDEPVRIARVPEIEDVHRMEEVLERIGCVVTREPGIRTIDASGCHTSELPAELIGKLRAGLVLLAPLLIRFGSVTLPMPGGDAIGRRPIDLFIDGLQAFGVTLEERPDALICRADRLHAARYVFPFVSVTGTETLMLLAVRTPDVTIIENAATEPEISALADFLNSCGARITGAGTSTIRITGVDHLRGGSVTCMPDRIETGAFAAMVAACGGSVEIQSCVPEHVAVALKILTMMGAEVVTDDVAGSIRVTARAPLRAVSFRTHEHPGLATDLQPPFTVAMTQARGLALIHETIYEGRLFYIDKLNKMGAHIILCDPHRCLTEGPRRLTGTTLESPDIRAGIALLIAAACADGRSTIDNVYQIDRGFERIEERLRGIGVRIARVEGSPTSGTVVTLPGSRSSQKVVG